MSAFELLIIGVTDGGTGYAYPHFFSFTARERSGGVGRRSFVPSLLEASYANAVDPSGARSRLAAVVPQLFILNLFIQASLFAWLHGCTVRLH
jgi:hypothetical protein